MTDHERYEAIEAELERLERAILARHRLINSGDATEAQETASQVVDDFADEVDRFLTEYWEDPACVTALDKAASYLCRAWDALGVPVGERGA